MSFGVFCKVVVFKHYTQVNLVILHLLQNSEVTPEQNTTGVNQINLTGMHHTQMHNSTTKKIIELLQANYNNSFTKL